MSHGQSSPATVSKLLAEKKSPLHSSTGKARTTLWGHFFNISNDVGRVKGLEVYVFVVSDTRIALAPKRWFLHENDGLFYSDNLHPTAWLGPVVFILVVDSST